MQRKTRKQENVQYIVKWISNNKMYFRAYKRDYAAIKFQEYLIEHEDIDPFDIRVLMPK
jgi:hypothetical protein